MLTMDDVVARATRALERFPHLNNHLAPDIIARNVSASWRDPSLIPQPPHPLIFWLFVAGSDDLVGKEAADDCLKSWDLILALLTKTKAVSGAWKSRASRLIPPRRGSGFEDHYANFQSALFELILAFRLVTPDGTVSLNGEGTTSACDLSVLFRGRPLVAIEAYAPRKGADLWYEEQVERPWQALLAGTHISPIAEDREVEFRNISIHPNAVSQALSNVLTDSNFGKQKSKQLASGDMPTLLAVRGYGLTRKLHELIALSPPIDIANRIEDDAWSQLPERCPGILLSFLWDVLKVRGRPSPVCFIPAPGRTVSSDLWDFLDARDMLSVDVLKQRGAIVGCSGASPRRR